MSLDICTLSALVGYLVWLRMAIHTSRINSFRRLVLSCPVFRPSSTAAEKWKKRHNSYGMGTIKSKHVLSRNEMNKKHLWKKTYSKRHFDWKYVAFVGSKIQMSKRDWLTHCQHFYWMIAVRENKLCGWLTAVLLGILNIFKSLSRMHQNLCPTVCQDMCYFFIWACKHANGTKSFLITTSWSRLNWLETAG